MKGKLNGTSVLIIIIGTILILYTGVAFWYVKIYSNDPIVMMNRQAPPLDMSMPLDKSYKVKLSDQLKPFDLKPTGSTVSFHNYNFKLFGELESTTSTETQSTVTYTTGEQTHTTIISSVIGDDYKSLVQDYIEKGDTKLFEQAFGVNVDEKYYQKYMTSYVPIAVSSGLKKTYMVVPADEDSNEYIIVQSDDAIILTGEMTSKVYRKLEDTVYSVRTFSHYEEGAIANTRAQVTGGTSSEVVDVEPTEDFDSVPSENKAKYTHDQLVELDAHLDRNKLRDDGSIAGTTIVLSTDNTDTEVDVTQGTIPVVNVDGLKIDNVSFQYDAAKKDNVLIFKGLTQTTNNTLDVQNQNSIDTEFIMLVKFISADGKVLDFVKISNIDQPLAPDEKRTFSMSLTDVKFAGTLQKIQFEVYR